ncbi:MAG: pyridoxal phosphate-dependent aminotransferase [candidate division Zixibacteria bacterium]|nr:pyridoxal phosphate-dependent aminotransferase [Candidatus Tariuqbacter arcticus]
MKLADSMSRLGTETAFLVLAKAKALEAKGREIIHLEIGEPDFDTPKNIIEAAVDAVRGGYTHYNPSPGYPDLRQAIADDINTRRGVNYYDLENVVVTPGAKPIMFFSLLATVNPGDEVIYPNPGFPIYGSVINWIGAKPVPIPLREENDFRMDVDEFRKLVTDKTKYVIINSPQNPTGGVLTKEDLAAIAEIALEKRFWVLSDEVYCNIVYEGEHHSLIEFPGMEELLILLDGFSKTYAMTGWRAGYGLMPKELAKWVAQLQTNSNSCVNSFVQRACIEAIKGPQDEVKRMVVEFKRRRDIIVDGLNEIPGFKCLRPKGSFYVFPNLQEFGIPSQKMEDFLMNEAGVAALTGTSFGKYGEGYIRFSYANSVENIQIALEKTGEAVKKL